PPLPPRSTLFPYTTLFRSQPPGVVYMLQLDAGIQWRQLGDDMLDHPWNIGAFHGNGRRALLQPRIGKDLIHQPVQFVEVPIHPFAEALARSEERRVGKEYRTRRAPCV